MATTGTGWCRIQLHVRLLRAAQARRATLVVTFSRLRHHAERVADIQTICLAGAATEDIACRHNRARLERVEPAESAGSLPRAAALASDGY